MARAPSGFSGPPFIPRPPPRISTMYCLRAGLRASHHFRGRIPVGPFQLMINGGSAGPEEAFSTNADAIAYRFITALHQIKEVAAGIDDDCAYGFVCGVSDYRARKGRVQPP